MAIGIIPATDPEFITNASPMDTVNFGTLFGTDISFGSYYLLLDTTCNWAYWNNTVRCVPIDQSLKSFRYAQAFYINNNKTAYAWNGVADFRNYNGIRYLTILNSDSADADIKVEGIDTFTGTEYECIQALANYRGGYDRPNPCQLEGTQYILRDHSQLISDKSHLIFREEVA